MSKCPRLRVQVKFIKVPSSRVQIQCPKLCAHVIKSKCPKVRISVRISNNPKSQCPSLSVLVPIGRTRPRAKILVPMFSSLSLNVNVHILKSVCPRQRAQAQVPKSLSKCPCPIVRVSRYKCPGSNFQVLISSFSKNQLFKTKSEYKYPSLGSNQVQVFTSNLHYCNV